MVLLCLGGVKWWITL